MIICCHDSLKRNLRHEMIVWVILSVKVKWLECDKTMEYPVSLEIGPKKTEQVWFKTVKRECRWQTWNVSNYVRDFRIQKFQDSKPRIPSLSTLDTLVSVYTFSILFSKHFLGCWQGEFFWQSTASLVGDHSLYSCVLHVQFGGDIVKRNWMLVTLRNQPVN